MVCNGLIKKSPDIGVGSAKFWLKLPEMLRELFSDSSAYEKS